MSRLVMSIAFLGSAVLLPWWMTVIFGVILLALWQSYVVVVVGGLAMDVLFASHGAAPFGFPFLYTFVFCALSVLTWYVHRTLLS